MIKTYKSNTNVSINVVLPNKKNLHIAFTPLSDGSSTYTTNNEVIMNAIESHYNFGKLFRLYCTKEDTIKETVEGINGSTESTIKNEEKTDTKGSEESGTTLKKVNVSDLSAAKEYLADNFGISRTSMRSLKAITEQAAAKGIEFVGLS